jgi:hypothetical protein
MKKISVLAVLIGVAATPAALTQELAQPTGQKTLAATVGVFVYPAEEQTPEKQSRDEVECYNWAVQTTKTDPFDLAKQSEQQAAQADQARQQVAQAGQGAGARGAVGGAAAGALIGEIASNDPGRGAAYGAAAGLIAGRHAKRRAQKEANEQIDKQERSAQQFTQKQIDDFKKAFGVCLEARDYMVK